MSFPVHLTGRALTAYNLIVFLSVFVLQAGLGLLIDRLMLAGLTESDAFRGGLAAIALLQALVWLVFVFGPWHSPAHAGSSTAGVVR